MATLEGGEFAVVRTYRLYVTSPLPLVGEGYNRKKKRVSWAEENDLVVVHYFEMDDSERGKCSSHLL